MTSAKADLADKSPYHPEWISARINEQADHFVSMIVGILSEFREQQGRPGMVVAPYDTELLGHWWFEGPEWVYQVLSRLQAHTQVSLTPGSQLLKEAAPRHVIQLPEGSWGEGGYHWIWLNEDNDWTWRHIYPAEKEMEELAQLYAEDPDPRLQDLLKQCGRSLFLLESSDWQFLISTFSARDYAELRVVVHHDDFKRLAAMVPALRRGPEPAPGRLEFSGILPGAGRYLPGHRSQVVGQTAIPADRAGVRRRGRKIAPPPWVLAPRGENNLRPMVKVVYKAQGCTRLQSDIGHRPEGKSPVPLLNRRGRRFYIVTLCDKGRFWNRPALFVGLLRQKAEICGFFATNG